MESRINQVGAELQRLNVHAFICPAKDPHGSEYPADHFQRRAALSGFDGSAGTAVVLHRAGKSTGHLFVDPRYWEEAANCVGDDWEIVKLGSAEAPLLTPESWLSNTLEAGNKVGCDLGMFSVADLKKLEQSLEKNNISVYKMKSNPVDQVWNDRPALPAKGCFVHPMHFAGQSVVDKISKVRQELSRTFRDALIVSDLSEIMWLFNLRGSDSLESPVMYSFALVTPSRAVFFAWGKSRVPQEVESKLQEDGVEVKEYEAFFDEIKSEMSGKKVWASAESTNARVADLLHSTALSVETKTNSPISLWKAIKNVEEQAGMRACQIRDASALVRFLAWMETEAGNVTETEAAEQLLQFRRNEPNFVTPSFATIMGSGPNGAIIHYHPSQRRPRVIQRNDMLLIDSGGKSNARND